MRRLSEPAFRHEDWVGGRPIRLADEQDWLLAPIDFHWVGHPWEPGPWWGMWPDPDPGADVMLALWRLGRATEAGRIWEPFFELARLLLLRNYALADDQVADLIPLWPDSRREAALLEDMGRPDEFRAMTRICRDLETHLERARENMLAIGIVCGQIRNGIDEDSCKYMCPGLDRGDKTEPGSD